MNENYYPYTNEDGKKVVGMASLNHYISEIGGIENYNAEIGKAYIEAFVAANKETIQSTIVAQHKRNQFKVV